MMFSVVSPVYKSRNSVRPLYEQLTTTLRAMGDFKDYELILVEDCGGDGSWEEIEKIAREDPHVVGVQLSRNFGQHHAITAGLDLCRGDWAVVMDCDLQDQPSAIPLMWEKAKAGFDVVNARRLKRKDPLWKTMRSRLYHVLFEWLSGLSYDPQVANFRLISRKVIEAFKLMRESSRGFSTQVHWLGFATVGIDIPHAARHAGKSSYTLRKVLALALEVAVSYSNRPLRISVGLGVIIAFIAAVCLLWIFSRALIWGVPVQGWASLMVSVWFLGGIIIANLGIIGVYIGQIYNETRRRPIYVIAKRLNG